MADQRTANAPGGGGAGGPVTAAALDPVRLLRMYYPYLAAAGVLGAVLGYGAYKLLQRYMPQWTSTVIFQGAEQALGGEIITTEKGGDAMERFLKTQAQVMMSDPVLRQVFDDNDVKDTSWYKDFVAANGGFDRVAALSELRKLVSAAPIPDTYMVRMSVTMPAAKDAPEIASAIQQVYMLDSKQQANQELVALQSTYKLRLEELTSEKERLDLRIQNELSGAELTSLNQRETEWFQQQLDASKQLTAAQQELALIGSNLDHWKDLRNAPGGMVFPEAVEEAARSSPIAQQLQAGIISLNADLEALREVFGDNHRQVRAIERRIRAQEEALDREVQRAMAEIFATQFEALQRREATVAAGVLQAQESLASLREKLSAVQETIQVVEGLQDRRGRVLDSIQNFEEKQAEVRVLIERPGRVRVVQAAQLPDSMSFPKLIPTVAVGVLLVAGAAAGFLLVREVREQRIRSAQDVALVPRTRVLGVIPDVGLDPASPRRVEAASEEAPDSATAEAIRQLRTAVLRACASAGHRTLVVTSGLPGSGSTAVVSNLARAVAALDARVLVIDANLRRPKLHDVFEVGQGPGLGEALTGASSLDVAAVASTTRGVSVLPAGNSREVDRLNTRTMTELLDAAKAEYDLVLIDAPPATVSTDAAALANRCDASMIVVRAYQEKRGLLARLRGQFADARAEFLGVVLNGAKPSAGGYLLKNIQATHQYGGSKAAKAAKPKAA